MALENYGINVDDPRVQQRLDAATLAWEEERVRHATNRLCQILAEGQAIPCEELYKNVMDELEEIRAERDQQSANTRMAQTAYNGIKKYGGTSISNQE